MDTQTLRRKKFIKVGNSAALTIDAQYLRDNNLATGDEMYIRYTDDGAIFAIPKKALHKFQGSTDEKKVKQAASKITPELITWTKNFLQENKESMEKLANL